MPHVTVLFDPNKIDQAVVDKLKKMLQVAVADALSSSLTLSTTEVRRENIAIRPADVYVGQHAAHETDINAAPIEILVEAGRTKGRSPELVAGLISKAVTGSGLIPKEYLGEGRSCIWVKFCEPNSFRFIGT